MCHRCKYGYLPLLSEVMSKIVPRCCSFGFFSFMFLSFMVLSLGFFLLGFFL